MTSYISQVNEAADWVASRTGHKPVIGLLTGTGLGAALSGMEITHKIPYEDIPHFPVSTVQSHQGCMLLGKAHGHSFLAMQGRIHLYEGYDVLQITFPIRVMQALGVKTLILANATGGLNPGFMAGDIMLIEDHINLSGENPLVGANVDDWGPRFPEMWAAYDEPLMAEAESCAKALGIELQKGVYVGLKGPSLETRAEMRYLHTIGADAVGFSTVNEVICAVHAGMRVLGFAIITNVNVPGKLTPSSTEDIIAMADKTAPKVEAIIDRVIAGI